jgi:DNA-binding transcriptional LysR family regulator
MEMHQVRYFLAVARLLNFTRAATECNVAQPSLTRAIKQLENEFGQELFRRERNLTHLTEFGRRMTPFLHQCYESAAAAKNLASSLKKGALAPLALAISGSISLSVIVSHLAELSRAFDGLELRLLRGTRDDISGHLRKGEADIALGRSIPNASRSRSAKCIALRDAMQSNQRISIANT